MQAGDYLEVAEDDYMFGVGLLRITLVEVSGYITCHNAYWQHVRGVEYGWNGATVNADREAWIRVPAQRKPDKK